MNYCATCLFTFVLLAVFSTSGFAEPYTLEGKAGVFIPSSNKMRKIFGSTLPFIELEGSYQLSSDWKVWAGVGYIFEKGKSIGCGSSTKIQVIPFTLGIKRFFPLTPQIDGFLGLGGLWTLYRNHDYSQSVHNHISANEFGAIVTGGFQYDLNDRFVVSFFGEYMYQRFSFNRVYSEHFTYRHDVDMSGTKIGFGLIYNF